MLNMKNITLLSLLGSSIITSHAFAMDTAGNTAADRKGDELSSHVGSRLSGPRAGAGVLSLTSEFVAGTRDVTGKRESKRSDSFTAENNEDQAIDALVDLYMKILEATEVPEATTQQKIQVADSVSKFLIFDGSDKTNKMDDVTKALRPFGTEVTKKNKENMDLLSELKTLCEKRAKRIGASATLDAVAAVAKYLAKIREASTKAVQDKFTESKGKDEISPTHSTLPLEMGSTKVEILVWKEALEAQVALAKNNITDVLAAIQMQHDLVQKEASI